MCVCVYERPCRPRNSAGHVWMSLIRDTALAWSFPPALFIDLDARAEPVVVAVSSGLRQRRPQPLLRDTKGLRFREIMSVSFWSLAVGVGWCQARLLAVRADMRLFYVGRRTIDGSDSWVVEEDWYAHCQSHLQSLTSMRRASFPYCSTLARPAFCPFCVGNEITRRLDSWIRDRQLGDQLEAHIRVPGFSIVDVESYNDLKTVQEARLVF